MHFVILGLALTRHLDFLFNDARHRLGPGTDFYAYYYAGKYFMQGEGIYGHGPGFGFRYHPAFAAVTGVFLSMLSVKAAFGLWVFLQELAFFFIWWRSRSLLRDDRLFLIASSILVFFSPYYLEAYMGNNSFLAAALLLAAFENYLEDKTRSFVLLMTISIILKPVGLVFLPLLLFRKQYRETAVILAVGLLTAVPFFLFDKSAWTTFIGINFHAIPAAGWVVHAGNQGFHGLLTDLCARLNGISTAQLTSFAGLPFPCRTGLALLPFIFIVVSAAAAWRQKDNLHAGIFLWSSTYLLGYKDVWEHSYSFAVLPLIFLCDSRIVSKRTALIFFMLLALPTGFLFYDLSLPAGPVDPEHQWPDWISFLHHGTKSLILLSLYLWIVMASLKRKDS